MRLVKEPIDTISDDDAKILLDLVLSAEEQNKEKYFNLYEEQLKWVTVGSKIGNPEQPSGMLHINLGIAHIANISSSLYFNNPGINTYPLDPNKEGSAETWKELLNAYITRTGYNKETKLAVSSAVLFGEGWKKWMVISSDDNDSVSISESSKVMPIGKSGFLMFGEYIDARCVITDCKFRTLDNSRFIAIKYEKPLDEILADDRYEDIRDSYSKEMNSIYNTNGRITSIAHINDGEKTSDELSQIVTFYEVWVYQLVGLKLYKQVLVLSPHFNKPMRGPLSWEEYLGPYVKSYPFTKVEIDSILDLGPRSSLNNWRELQVLLDWLVTKIGSFVSNRKQIYAFYESNAVNPDIAYNQLMSGKPIEFIKAKDPGVPVLEPINKHTTSADDWNFLNFINSAIQQVSGIGQNRRGSAGIRTATEASIIEQAAEVREGARAESVASFIKDDMTILINLIRGFYNEDFSFRLIGSRGPIKWGNFTEFDADWSPDVEVDPESFKFSSNSDKVQKLMTAINVALPMTNLYGGRIRADVMLKELITNLKIGSADKFIDGTIPGEVKQMTEIIAMIFGMEAPVVETDDHATELKTIVDFISTPVFESLPIEIKQAIGQHAEQHELIIKQLQANSESPVTNQDLSSLGNNASDARVETEQDREGVGYY